MTCVGHAFFFSLSLLLSFSLFSPCAFAQGEKVCIIITGLGGMPEYEENFLNWARQTEALFRDELESIVYRIDARQQKKSDILQLFDQVSSSPPSGEV
ncbi:MAG: hypothetical protein O7G29_01500, partial [Acidobacteria bacterium]|nr:hypothetical protein [Acidobacteriota bacterium]